MQNSMSGGQKQQNTVIKQNTVEILRDFSSSVAKNTANDVAKIGTGIFDQLLGHYSPDTQNQQEKLPQQPRPENGAAFKPREFISLYNFQKEQEVRTIKSLIEQIRREIQVLKKANSALMSEVKDIEKISVNNLTEQPGIYHVRFLEIVLNIIKVLHAKISESQTWMQALLSKKKKRGSAFASLSKKQGTQYSLSQELATTRSVQ